MSFLTINTELCLHDGICAQECPIMLISLNGGTKLPKAVEDAEEKCVKCGHCMAVCPQNAISVKDIKSEDMVSIKDKLKVSDNQLEQLIKSRRSIRNFKNKKIDQEVLTKLIETARYAPTGGNSQQVEWLVIKSPESVYALAEKVMGFFREIAGTNHPLNERYNLNRYIERWENGYDVIFRGAPSLVIAHTPKKYGLGTIDNTIALSYLDLAATNFGLGTCWAGFFMIAAIQSPEVINFMNLPEGNVCTGALMLGYAKNKYHMIPPRNEAKIIWRD